MRAVFIGTNGLTMAAARHLIDDGHEVVIIESSREKIDDLSDEMDCSFLHGDGTRPQLLREVGPQQTDVLFCLTDNDQSNILATLIARTLKFEKVVTAIHDPELMAVCEALGLEHTIIPDETIGRYLADMAKGLDIIELSTMIKGSARFFSFVASKEDAGGVEELALPDRARVVCVYRGDEFFLPDDDSKIRPDDEVVIITDNDHLPELRKRWEPRNAE